MYHAHSLLHNNTVRTSLLRHTVFLLFEFTDFSSKTYFSTETAKKRELAPEQRQEIINLKIMGIQTEKLQEKLIFQELQRIAL